MTTAATTAFCAEKIEGSDGRFLWVDGNGKITAGNGTLADPKPNAFSLIQIADCPFATSICKASCYVHGLEKHAPDTHALYKHNSVTIRQILAGDVGFDSPDQWARRLGSWIAQNCAGNEFRWHVSGDIFSLRYARWIAQVCQAAPDVRHWIYTRSFEYVGPLMAAPNLTVNLSCDAENYHEATKWKARIDSLYGAPHTRGVRHVRLCYLTHDGAVPEDLPRGSVIFPDYELRESTPAGKDWFQNYLMPSERQMVCPVDYHGKSERRRCGPCNKCIKEPK